MAERLSREEQLRKLGMLTDDVGQVRYVSLHTGTNAAVVEGVTVPHQGYLQVPESLRPQEHRTTLTCLSCGALVGDRDIHTPVCPGTR